jgi:hypothetical protein
MGKKSGRFHQNFYAKIITNVQNKLLISNNLHYSQMNRQEKSPNCLWPSSQKPFATLHELHRNSGRSWKIPFARSWHEICYNYSLHKIGGACPDG